MPALLAPLEEARENLRVIRQTMERSTQYSTLSGASGVLIGLLAIAGVWATYRMTLTVSTLAAVWIPVLLLAVGIDFVCNKRRAARIGKRVVSPLGAHIVLAALPAFFAGAILTLFFATHGWLLSVWGVWMLCYGLAICAVGLFSVKPVSFLGAAFAAAGGLTLLLPSAWGLPMMAATFGGFHIGYGVLMARRCGW